MKTKSSLRIFNFLAVIILVLGNATAVTIPVAAAASGSASATVTPSNANPNVGTTITAAISINVSGVNSPDNKLGSFTGSLDWDPAILGYASNGGLLAGFTGAINTATTSSGHLAFNGANTSGATGNNIVLNVTFNVTGGGTSVLNLGVSAMSAATTFTDLLPILTVNDSSVTAVASSYTLSVSRTGTGSGTVTSTPSGINCGSTCSASFTAGASVSLSASPAGGSTFGGWSGACSGTGACSVTMSTARSVTATFTAATTITFTGTELLGRAETDRISISCVPASAATIRYQYDSDATGEPYANTSSSVAATAGQPAVVLITGLSANTRYFYRMQYSTDGGSTWTNRTEKTFRTQRAVGSTFTFDITSDSHISTSSSATPPTGTAP